MAAQLPCRQLLCGELLCGRGVWGRTALATSVVSARVGRGLTIMLSSICPHGPHPRRSIQYTHPRRIRCCVVRCCVVSSDAASMHSSAVDERCIHVSIDSSESRRVTQPCRIRPHNCCTRCLVLHFPWHMLPCDGVSRGAWSGRLLGPRSPLVSWSLCAGRHRACTRREAPSAEGAAANGG
jgi:hypothetical protein